MSNARFSITPSIAVEDKRISNAQYRTLAALGRYGDKAGWCFPKLATLGKLLGKSRQAVSKDIQALKKYGYIQIHPQYRDDKSRKNNLYRIVFDAPPQRGVDTPSTSEVDTPQPLRVDALTPHINDPKEEDMDFDEELIPYLKALSLSTTNPSPSSATTPTCPLSLTSRDRCFNEKKKRISRKAKKIFRTSKKQKC